MPHLNLVMSSYFLELLQPNTSCDIHVNFPKLECSVTGCGILKFFNEVLKVVLFLSRTVKYIVVTVQNNTLLPNLVITHKSLL